MDNYNRPGRKRLSLDIPFDVYMKIRMMTGYKGCTLTKWAIRAFIDKLKDEEKLIE